VYYSSTPNKVPYTCVLVPYCSGIPTECRSLVYWTVYYSSTPNKVPYTCVLDPYCSIVPHHCFFPLCWQHSWSNLKARGSVEIEFPSASSCQCARRNEPQRGYPVFVQELIVLERWSHAEINIGLPAICVWMDTQTGAIAEMPMLLPSGFLWNVLPFVAIRTCDTKCFLFFYSAVWIFPSGVCV